MKRFLTRRANNYIVFKRFVYDTKSWTRETDVLTRALDTCDFYSDDRKREECGGGGSIQTIRFERNFCFEKIEFVLV